MGEKKLNLISLDEAVELVKGHYSRASLYRFLSQKKLKRYGPFHHAHVDKDELIARCKLKGIVDA